MIAPDSSVVIAGFASWHSAHDAAAGILGGHPRLIAQCALETYSVLTRLPAPHRADAMIVQRFLHERFPERLLSLEVDPLKDWISRFPTLGITGGAVYDAIIAATAQDNGATLVTLDTRAMNTYARCGARVELVG